MDNKLSIQIELAWAAGFFDGEGSTSFNLKDTRSLNMSISQVEYQPLRRFQLAIGDIGTIYWHNRIHILRLYNRNALVALQKLYPYLSEPKRNQLINALLHIALKPVKKPNGNKRKEYCLRGHKFSETGVYVDRKGRRECLVCRDARKKGILPAIQPRIEPPYWLPMRAYNRTLGVIPYKF